MKLDEVMLCKTEEESNPPGLSSTCQSVDCDIGEGLNDACLASHATQTFVIFTFIVTTISKNPAEQMGHLTACGSLGTCTVCPMIVSAVCRPTTQGL